MATNVPNYVLVLQLEQVLCPVPFHSLFEDQLGSSFVAMCREDPLSPEEDNKVLVTFTSTDKPYPKHHINLMNSLHNQLTSKTN